MTKRPWWRSLLSFLNGTTEDLDEIDRLREETARLRKQKEFLVREIQRVRRVGRVYPVKIERTKERRVIPQEALDWIESIKGDKEKCRQVLIDIGLLNPDGSKSIHYYSEEEGGKEWPPHAE